MKIYTGGGDRGKTGLFSGERVAKSNPQVDAYGDVDELNSMLGALAASLPAEWLDISEQLQRIQSFLIMRPEPTCLSWVVAKNTRNDQTPGA